MKHLVFGDIHGRELSPLEREIEKVEPDTVLCTCDFDTPEAINQFRQLERKLETRGVEVFSVPGNHDDAVLHGLDITSRTLRQQGSTVPDLHQRLQQEEEAKSYLKDLLPDTRKRLEIGGRNAILIHGALEGDLRSYPTCPPEKQDFWRRLLKMEDHRENFEAMEAAGLELMVRGHDHEPELASYRNGDLKIEKPSPGESFQLDSSHLYTVTHGAWFDGWHLTVDSQEALEVRFRRV